MVMRREHDQMRTLFAQIEDALQRHDEDDFLGSTETLLILIQQHNMKEEGMLTRWLMNSSAVGRSRYWVR